MRQREKQEEGKVTIAFTLNTKKHPEIWAWLQSQPPYRRSRAIREALKAYMEADALAVGPLLRESRKNGHLYGAGMNTRNVSERVKVLAVALGIEGLSAHDCRHYWATQAARSGTPVDRLQDAGGWTSPAMPLHYIEAAKIANEGVVLD
jgi:integrase